MRVRCCYLAPSIPPIRKPRQIYDVKAFYTHFLPSSFSCFLFLIRASVEEEEEEEKEQR
jgi:hypothetical protein